MPDSIQPKFQLAQVIGLFDNPASPGHARHQQIQSAQTKASCPVVKTEHGSANVFNITKPGHYRCQVFHYHRKLSRLYLSVYQGQRNQPAFYILFSDVAYIEAPMSWESAEFDIAAKQECIDLMIQAGLVGPAIRQFPNAFASITEYARLYQVQTFNGVIRIIASSGTLMKRIPAEIQ